MKTTTLDMFYEGPSLFNNKVNAGMRMNAVLDLIFKEVNDLNGDLDLSCYNYRDKLGIKHECTDTTSFLCKILSELSSRSIDLEEDLKKLTTAAGNSSNEYKVGIDSSDTTPDFLENKLTVKQRGNLTKSNGVLLLNGTVPKGTLIYVDVSRYGDFDMTGSSPGKGKDGTDLEGWAIANGKNGTRNVIGSFVRGVSGTTSGTGGATSVKLDAKHMPGMTFNFTLNLQSALNKIRAVFRLNPATVQPSADPSAAEVLAVGDGSSGTNTISSDEINLAHSHSGSVQASSSNATQEEFSILPPYIEYIPIQRIV